jgi:hypothetical protein
MIEKLLTEDFVEKYNKKEGIVKGGALCFYGHWFGRPYDNYHKLELATFDQITNTLTLTFDEKETLTILNPQDISEIEGELIIGSADSIHWKWFLYGNAQEDNNLYFIEINRTDNVLTGNSNITSYQPDFKDLNIIKPALLWT